MSETVLEGASLPDGIEVDETSAYFGITSSSDIVHQMMSMEPLESIVAFFQMVSEIVLKPGEFDFEEASQVLNCEGGEIYFLVSGHLGLMSFTDPLLHYLGLTDSMGVESPHAKPDLTEAQFASLERLSDPMNILKLLAIAQSTGGAQEVVKYYLTMAEILTDVKTNNALLIEIANEFDAALDVIGHPIPISNLANSTVDTTTPLKAHIPAASQTETITNQSVIVDTPAPKQSKFSTPVPTTASVPLPGKPAVDEISEVPKVNVSPEPNITDRKAAKVTDTAFEGAFGMMSNPEPSLTSQVNEEPTEIEADVIEESIDSTQSVTDEVIEQTSTDEKAVDEVIVTAAEAFIQADVDDDGTLSVTELAEAAGISPEESEVLHKAADKDNDGSVSLSEFIASPAAEKVASNLPRPVAPVRKPVNRTAVRPNIQQGMSTQQANQLQNIAPRPIPPQNVAPQPTARPQPVNQPPPQNPQQQRWNQPVQPTIRSGVSCRSCGIGIDPYWRYCPVCGGQNLA